MQDFSGGEGVPGERSQEGLARQMICGGFLMSALVTGPEGQRWADRWHPRDVQAFAYLARGQCAIQYRFLHQICDAGLFLRMFDVVVA